MIFHKLLLAISVLFLATVIILHRDTLFRPFNVQQSTYKFEHSQWRVAQSKTPISDEELYSYAGYKYIHGENPFNVTPEIPTVGKYLIGLSILLFNNQHIASLFAALGSLVLIYFITRHVMHSDLAGSVAVALTTSHSLFIDQILHSPQLDIFQLFFLLFFIFFFIQYLHHKKMPLLIAAGVAIGLFISIKAFLVFFVLMNSWLVLFYLLHKDTYFNRIKELVIINMTALVVYTVSYFRYFMLGHTFRELLGAQKWVYTFYSQSHIDMSKLVGNYLFLTLFNRWRFWTEGYPVIQYASWNILWPVIFILGIVCGVILLKEKRKDKTNLMLLITFFIVYNGMLLAVPVFPRYLLMLFVPLHMFIAGSFAKILKK